MRPDRSGCCKKLNIHTHFIKMAKSPNWPLNDIAPKEIIFGVRCALLPSFHLLRHHPRWTTNKIKFDLPFHYPGIIQSPALHPLFSQSHIQLPNGIILLLLLLLPQPTLTTLVASPGICQNKHLVPVIDSSNILLRQKNIVLLLLLLMMIWSGIEFLHNLIRPCIVQWLIFSKELSHRSNLFQGNQIATGTILDGSQVDINQWQDSSSSQPVQESR